MKNSLRLLVLCGVLSLLASPAAFADGSGPGGTNPPPTSPTSNGTMTTGSSTGSAVTTLISTVQSVLGAVGF
jgi:hypothetical protein